MHHTISGITINCSNTIKKKVNNDVNSVKNMGRIIDRWIKNKTQCIDTR